MTTFFSRWAFLYLITCCDMAFSFESHCEDKTQTVFNCRLENSTMTVSVCKIGEEISGRQYLQFVLGEIGKAELVFPEEEKVEPEQFLFTRQYSDSAGYLEYRLAFAVGGNDYIVHWAESSKTDGVPKDENEISSGVSVLANTGETVHHMCNENVDQDFMSGVTTFVFNAKWVDA